MESEDIIIKKAVQGNEQAFRLLVERYQDFVIKVCFNVVKDSSHTENIAQEVFLQVFRALPTYQYKGFKTWIGRIALNKAIDYQRKINAQKKREVALTEEFQNTLIDDGRNDIEGFWGGEDRKRLLSLCDNLPEIYRIIVSKYYIQEKCYSEIAKEENISVKTVESRLYRARKLLKERWEVEDI
jgi:RNA polymerase sigma factor (sigma-70 family)